MEKKLSGRWGEQVAAEYLKKMGYRLVGLNYSCRLGEIDLIAKDRRYMVFAEVKLRKNADFAQAREFVTRSKQLKIIKTASLWLVENPTQLQPRFDVIEIYGTPDARSADVKINHIENAFE